MDPTQAKKVDERSSQPAVVAPKSTPKDWGEKVSRAKEARRTGAKLRSGKPATFSSRSWRS